MRARGACGKHQEQPLKALQLHHEDRDHDQDHEWEDRKNTGFRLGALLDRAANNHVIARRQLRLERGEIGGERFHNGRCLQARRGVGLHGNGWQTMATPDQRRFDPVGELRHLLKRDRTPARQIDHQTSQGLQLGALVRNGAGDDVDQIDVIAQLRHRRARQDGINGLAQCLRTDAESTSPVLIHLCADDFGRLVPIEVDVPCIWILAQQRREVQRDVPDLHGVGDR
jgi:hypothetical protein